MAWVDYLIIGILVLSALISLLRGFVREAFSLAVWMLAFWVSWSFFRALAWRFEPWVETPTVRLALAFAVLMVVTLTVGGLVNYLIVQLVQRTGLSGTDRLVGMVFGLARGVLLVTVLVLLAGLTPMPQDPWWHESQLLPYFEELALWLRDLLPEDIAGRFQYAAVGGRFG